MNAGVCVSRSSHRSRQRGARDRRIRRQGVPDQHRDRPLQHVDGQDAAPAVMHVVRVAVVAGAQGEDRPQGRRAQRRHLEAVEPAPRDARHADVPVAPRLGGQPGDHVAAVPQLLGGVLVTDDALGVAGAPQSTRAQAYPRAGEVGVDRRVPRGHQVALPVGQEVEYRRDRSRAASSGSQIRAASLVPSGIGIHVCSIVRTTRPGCANLGPPCTSMTICDNSRVRLYMAVQYAHASAAARPYAMPRGLLRDIVHDGRRPYDTPDDDPDGMRRGGGPGPDRLQQGRFQRLGDLHVRRVRLGAAGQRHPACRHDHLGTVTRLRAHLDLPGDAGRQPVDHRHKQLPVRDVAAAVLVRQRGQRRCWCRP